MIEILHDFPANVVAVRCSGRVSKSDYETVLIAAVNTALDQHPKVRVYYETADDFSGLEAGAIWEDLKVGMGHLTRWERVAVVTDVEWIKQAMRLFEFMLAWRDTQLLQV
jgi:SpoIIAA-like